MIAKLIQRIQIFYYKRIKKKSVLDYTVSIEEMEKAHGKLKKRY